MVTPEDILAQLIYRIQSDLRHFEGSLPERTATAWRGYLAAMYEWDKLSLAQYRELLALLPSVDDDPAVSILLGRD